MKMKITKSILMAVALVALTTQSCKDFLDETLVSNVAANSYYATPQVTTMVLMLPTVSSGKSIATNVV